MHWPVICEFGQIENLALEAVQDGRSREIVTLNPEILLSTFANRDEAPVFAHAAAMTIDSFSLLIGLRVWGLNAKRYTGIDLVTDCFDRCNKSASYLLYGAKPGIAQKVAEQAALAHATVYDGYNFSVEEVCKRWDKDRAPPDFCFIALGGVKQYEATSYIARTIRPRIIVACGGAFDVLSGTLPRAPVWMRTIGLEWLFRVMRQPARLPRLLNVLRGLGLVGTYCRVFNDSNIEFRKYD